MQEFIIYPQMPIVLSMQNAIVCANTASKAKSLLKLNLRALFPVICLGDGILEDGNLGLVIKHTHKNPLVFQKDSKAQ